MLSLLYADINLKFVWSVFLLPIVVVVAVGGGGVVVVAAEKAGESDKLTVVVNTSIILIEHIFLQ